MSTPENNSGCGVWTWVTVVGIVACTYWCVDSRSVDRNVISWLRTRDEQLSRDIVGIWKWEVGSSYAIVNCTASGKFTYIINEQGPEGIPLVVSRIIGADESHGMWVVRDGVLHLEVLGLANPAAAAFLKTVQEAKATSDDKKVPRTIKLTVLNATDYKITFSDRGAFERVARP